MFHLQKTNEDVLKEIDIIHANLKSEILHEIKNSGKNIDEICYDMQLTKEQFLSYLMDKSDVGFCADAAKILVKYKKDSK